MEKKLARVELLLASATNAAHLGLGAQADKGQLVCGRCTSEAAAAGTRANFPAC